MAADKADEVRSFITQKINETKVEEYPFQHVVIDDFLPKEFYRQLNRYFPEHTDIGFHDFMKWKYRFIKTAFDLETSNPNPEAKNLYKTFSQIFTRELAENILNKFNVEVDGDIGWMCDYCWDLPHENRQALEPHTDNISKYVSMIIYLPSFGAVDGRVQYLPMPGTDLLIKNADESFTAVKEVKAQGNRATIFRRSEESWHSVELTRFLRKTITMFIVNPTKCKDKHGFFYIKV